MTVDLKHIGPDEKPIILKRNNQCVELTYVEASLLNYALSKETSLGNILKLIGENYDNEWFHRVLGLLYGTMLTSRDEPFEVDARTATLIHIVIKELNDDYPNTILENFMSKIKLLLKED